MIRIRKEEIYKESSKICQFPLDFSYRIYILYFPLAGAEPHPVHCSHPQPQSPRFLFLTMLLTARNTITRTTRAAIIVGRNSIMPPLENQQSDMVNNACKKQGYTDVVQRNAEWPFERVCFMYSGGQSHYARHIEIKRKDEGQSFRLSDCGRKCAADG